MIEQSRILLELIGDESDLRDLARAFSQPPITVQFIDRIWILDADRVQDADRAVIRTLCDELVSRINGAHRAVNPLFGGVKLGPICQRREGGGWAFHETSVVKARLVPSLLLEPNPLPPRTAKYVSLADVSDDARELLFYLSQAADWFVLYKVYEVLERHGWLTRADQAKSKTRLVKQTCNMYRHAESKPEPLKKPVPFVEARSHTFELARRWLDDHCV